MQRAKIAELIGTRIRGVLRPPYRRLAIVLACEACRNTGATVIAPPSIREVIAQCGCSTGSCDDSPDGSIIVLWCSGFRQAASAEIVFAAGVEVKGLRLIRAVQLADNKYLVKYGDVEELVVLDGFSVYRVEGPNGAGSRALEIICNAINDYGAMRVSELVDILSAELGVTRTSARNILLELARQAYIVVDKGFVVKTRVC